MFTEKYFLNNNTIKTGLSFTLVHTSFGPLIKLFRHYGTPDAQFDKHYTILKNYNARSDVTIDI